MFQKLNNVLILIIIFAFVSPIFAESPIENFKSMSTKSGYELYEVATYMGYTGQNFKIGWDANPEPDIYGYEVRVYHVEQERYLGKTIKLIGSNSTELDYTPQISGHYVFEIRAVDLAGQYSDWASSLDANVSRVNGKNEGFWIYVHIAPPSDEITFE